MKLTRAASVHHSLILPISRPIYIVTCQRGGGLQQTARAATRHGSRDPLVSEPNSIPVQKSEPPWLPCTMLKRLHRESDLHLSTTVPKLSNWKWKQKHKKRIIQCKKGWGSCLFLTRRGAICIFPLWKPLNLLNNLIWSNLAFSDHVMRNGPLQRVSTGKP